MSAYKILNRTPKYDQPHPLSPTTPMVVSETKEELFDAIVVDVIVNEEHPEYSADGYNVGAAQFRLIDGDHFRPAGKLHWAFPDDSNISEFPLKNEFVKIYKSLNRYFYSRKLNVGKGLSDQSMFGLAEEMKTIPTNQKKMDGFERSKALPVNIVDSEESLGKYFQKKEVPRLRHWEGDILFEGRSGQSIRLGSSWISQKIHLDKVQSLENDQSPTILLRVGGWKDAPKTIDNNYGRVYEDINKDSTSLWMTEDQVVALEPATKDIPQHKKSIREYPSLFSGRQIILNTDRVLINTKESAIFLFSKTGIHSTSEKDYTIDTKEDYYSYIGRDRLIETVGNNIQNVQSRYSFWVGSTATTNVRSTYTLTADGVISLSSKASLNILAPKIYLGTEASTSEPMVLGETLKKLLKAFIQAHLTNSSTHVITSMGPGTLNPGLVAELRRIMSQLDNNTILSDDNFVTKKNSTSRTVPARTPLH